MQRPRAPRPNNEETRSSPHEPKEHSEVRANAISGEPACAQNSRPDLLRQIPCKGQHSKRVRKAFRSATTSLRDFNDDATPIPFQEARCFSDTGLTLNSAYTNNKHSFCFKGYQRTTAYYDAACKWPPCSDVWVSSSITALVAGTTYRVLALRLPSCWRDWFDLGNAARFNQSLSKTGQLVKTPSFVESICVRKHLQTATSADKTKAEEVSTRNGTMWVAGSSLLDYIPTIALNARSGVCKDLRWSTGKLL